MNTIEIIANGLVIITFLVHTFAGDSDLRKAKPHKNTANYAHQQQIWIMARGAFHLVSIDFLLASIAFTLVNFTNFFADKTSILKILSLYFGGYGIAFLISIIISDKIPNAYLKLPQWILLLGISILIYLGI
ncbi:hypothetical protein [Flexibacter flexilis]|nr:hypothetical protein [Flexibacter flexilis]